MSNSSITVEQYRQCFRASPTLVARAPGRVNLIGEHTDYNEGFVLPFAVDRSVEVAAGPGEADSVTVHSMLFDETVTFGVNVSGPAAHQHWQNYVRGVVSGIRTRGLPVHSTNLCIGGDLPVGGGLSSSAALCVAATQAILRVSGGELHQMEVVRLARAAERQFAGIPCGIMDPYVSMFGRADHALLLDCRRLDHKDVPVAVAGHSLLAIPSGIQRELAGGPYEKRVAECRAAVAAIKQIGHTIRALRDATEEMLSSSAKSMDAVLLRRARHVVAENARVHRFVEALRAGEPDALGRLLNESHASLRDEYEVSCPAMDTLVAGSQEIPGVLGARMIGGGFGGTVLALVRDDTVPNIVDRAAKLVYGEGDEHGITVVRPGPGAEVYDVKRDASA